jgi:hypothetical protein
LIFLNSFLTVRMIRAILRRMIGVILLEALAG